MKRVFDIILATLLVATLFVLFIACFLLIKMTSKGPAVYWSKRVGRNNKIFLMPKFRTMYIDTPQVATHLLQNSKKYVTPVGKILRKTSLDEIPQLWSIIRGEMSFVGPRPALFNQFDLIELRKKNGVERLTPGLTGWAQINGRDSISIPDKVELDTYYVNNYSFLLDVKIMVITGLKIFKDSNVAH